MTGASCILLVRHGFIGEAMSHKPAFLFFM